MKRRSQHQGTGRRSWKRVIILPLCTCLVITCSVTNSIWSADASEDKRLHKLFRGQQVNATLKNPGGYLEGRVEMVHKGLVAIDVEKSSRSSSIPLGFQEIPVDRLSTVRWRQGSKYRVILTTVGILGGLVAGLWVGWEEGKNLPLVLIPALAGTFGHYSGKRLDQRSITLSPTVAPARKN